MEKTGERAGIREISAANFSKITKVANSGISLKKKVMLVLPNHRWATSDEYHTMWIIFPTQMCLLAAQLEEKYDVKIVDCIIDDIREEDFAEIVRKEKPDVVGLSNFTSEYSKAGHKAIDVVKSVDSGIITIMGGVYVITSPEAAMANTNLDYAVIGEGEVIFGQLLAHLFEGKQLPEKGIGYRRNGKTVIQPRADFIQNLDALKYPAYHLIDFMKYATRYAREAIDRPRALPFARLCVTRGCPIGCTFCVVESVSGGPTRYRSAEHVIGEMEMLIKNYGVKCFIFDDDNLFMNKHKAEEFLQMIIDKKLNIIWQGPATAVFMMDEHSVDLCKASGCVYLNIAIESGSPRVLKEIIKKPIHFDRLLGMINYIKKVGGIDLAANFIIGSPGETYDEILQTIRFAEMIDLDYVKFFISTPFPHTKMFEMAKKMGYLDDTLKFDEHHWTFGTFNTPHFRARDLAVLRAYEWDRINFGTPEKKKKVMQMMDVTEERLDEIRRATREIANPDDKPKAQHLKPSRYYTTKEKSVEEAKRAVLTTAVEATTS